MQIVLYCTYGLLLLLGFIGLINLFSRQREKFASGVGIFKCTSCTLLAILFACLGAWFNSWWYILWFVLAVWLIGLLDIVVQRTFGTSLEGLRWEGAIVASLRLPMHNAAKIGDTDTITRLAGDGHDINYAPHLGIAPLHIAATFGSIDAARRLIELGADIEAKTVNGGTAIYFAKMKNHSEIVELLVMAGAK